MNKCFYCARNTHSASSCPAKQYDKNGKLLEAQIKELGYLSEEQLPPVISTLLERELFRKTTWLAYLFRPGHIDDIILHEPQKGIFTQCQNIHADAVLLEAEQLRGHGQKKFSAGSAAEAAAILGVASEKNPRDYRIQMYLGYALIENDQLPGAANCFKAAQQVIASDYYASLALLLQARLYQHTGETAHAVQVVRQVIDLNQHPQEAFFLLATLHAELGQPEPALAALSSAVKLDRSYALAPAFEPVFDHIKHAWQEWLINCVSGARQEAQKSLGEAKDSIRESERQEALIYDPSNFKTATAKTSLAEKKLDTRSYYGSLDTCNLTAKSVAELNIAQKSTRMRREITLAKVTEYVQSRMKAGWIGAVTAAGWGLVAGGAIGMVKFCLEGEESQWAIWKYGLKGALLAFWGVFIYNQATIGNKQKQFFDRFTKQFRNKGIGKK